jgi:hypothetical protein
MTQSPSDLGAKILQTFDAVSGWTFFALALAGTVILVLPDAWGGNLLGDVRRTAVGPIFAGVIVAVFLTLAKVARSRISRLGWNWLCMQCKIVLWRRRIDKLTAQEKAVLSWCLHNHSEKFRAAKFSVAARGLIDKQIVFSLGSTFSGDSWIYVIREDIWDMLQYLRQQIRDGAPPENLDVLKIWNDLDGGD